MSDQERAAAAEAQGRWFYVSVRNGARYGLLAGPFATHAEALRWVKPVKELAVTVNWRSQWYAFGTCSAASARAGRLNSALGLPVQE